MTDAGERSERKTGKRRETVAMALTYDPMTREKIVCSVWGTDTDWISNLRARPALQIQIGDESYVPEQRFLSENESVAVGVDFRRRHPWRLRLQATILGWATSAPSSGARVRSQPSVRLVPPGVPSALSVRSR